MLRFFDAFHMKATIVLCSELKYNGSSKEHYCSANTLSIAFAIILRIWQVYSCLYVAQSCHLYSVRPNTCTERQADQVWFRMSWAIYSGGKPLEHYTTNVMQQAFCNVSSAWHLYVMPAKVATCGVPKIYSLTDHGVYIKKHICVLECSNKEILQICYNE